MILERTSKNNECRISVVNKRSINTKLYIIGTINLIEPSLRYSKSIVRHPVNTKIMTNFIFMILLDDESHVLKCDIYIKIMKIW